MPDKKLKSTGITLDGTPIALRPLLPEDEPALQDLFAHMSREDVRLRFFTPMRELKHALAARLSHLDYSREMALVRNAEAARFALDSLLEGGVRCELVSAAGPTPPIKGSFIAGLMNS